MEEWHVALFSVALPTLATVVFKYLTDRGKARVEHYLTNAEVGARIRDELRGDNEAMRQRIEALTEQVDAIRNDREEETRALIKRLEEAEEAEDECRRDRDRLHAELADLRRHVTRLEGRVRNGGADNTPDAKRRGA